MTNLHCITWNIRGLNDHRKVRLVHSYLIRKSIDICLLQETHLTTATMGKLKSNRWGAIYAASYSSYSRGVAILIKKGIPWRACKIVIDPEGRFVLALGSLHNKSVILPMYMDQTLTPLISTPIYGISCSH